MFAFGKSNFRLSGQKLFLDFKNPFKILAEAEPRLWRGEATIAQKSQSENWRKREDSNLWWSCDHTCFQDKPDKPLRHASLAERARFELAWRLFRPPTV